MGRAVLAGVILLLPAAIYADDWPQWLGHHRDGIWRETGILDKFPKGGPTLLWRKEVGGGFSGPAVANGRVYVMDRQGPSLPKGKEAPEKAGLTGKEQILCLDATSGDILWKQGYDCRYRVQYTSGPRATPLVREGKVYTLGAMGDLMCLDAAKGTIHWRKNLSEEYKCKPPLWGYAAHPLIEGNSVICLAGGEGSAVVALDKDTGVENWKALTVQEIGYAPPMVFDVGGVRQLIIWHTEALVSLDPKNGKVYWSVKFPEGDPERPGISVATPRLAGDLLFVSSPHHGSLVIKLAKDKPAAEVLWKGKSRDLSRPDGLHNLMGSPVLWDGHVYGVCNFGELRCLDATTGKRVWEHQTMLRKTLAATTFIVPHRDRFFLFSDEGELIIARLTPKGYEEIDRAKVIEPTLFSRGRQVVWSHPAFANRCLYVRNDREIVCLSLAAES
jgi:outer membrane protein assembly factor BamB